MSKLVLEINKPLRNNDILLYRDGELIPVDVNSLFVKINKEIIKLQEENKELRAELEKQKKMIEKNAHDILVDRGIIDEE